VPDGYGINYCIGAKAIKFGVESKHSCKETSTQKFKAVLAQALIDLRDVSAAAKDSRL
jgi:carnitine O-acetyltransferase